MLKLVWHWSLFTTYIPAYLQIEKRLVESCSVIDFWSIQAGSFQLLHLGWESKRVAEGEEGIQLDQLKHKRIPHTLKGEEPKDWAPLDICHWLLIEVHYFVDLSQLALRTGCLHALLIISNLLGGLLPIYIWGGGGWGERFSNIKTHES